MKKGDNISMAVFYCRNVLESSERNRRELEKEYGPEIRFYPVPCSGRLEPLQILRALEEFADAVYIITCPEGECRYFEGNIKAGKRVERTRSIIQSIGLEPERIGLLGSGINEQKTLSRFLDEIIVKSGRLSPSPVHKNRRNSFAGKMLNPLGDEENDYCGTKTN